MKSYLINLHVCLKDILLVLDLIYAENIPEVAVAVILEITYVAIPCKVHYLNGNLSFRKDLVPLAQSVDDILPGFLTAIATLFDHDLIDHLALNSILDRFPEIL